jgi:hypothetical protein
LESDTQPHNARVAAVVRFVQRRRRAHFGDAQAIWIRTENNAAILAAPALECVRGPEHTVTLEGGCGAQTRAGTVDDML